jgi:Clr5 domain
MEFSSADLPLFDPRELALSYPMPSHNVPDQAFGLYGNDPALEYPAFNTVPTFGQLASTFNYEPHSFDQSPAPYNNQPLNFQPPSNIRDTAAPSMGPPTRMRKRKAPTLRVDAWEPYKARIIELHIEQGLSLGKVKDAIEKEFAFTAEYVP